MSRGCILVSPTTPFPSTSTRNHHSLDFPLHLQPPRSSSPSSHSRWKPVVLSALLSLALTLNPSPSSAIPSLTSPPPTTPFSQSKNLPLGLLDGKIMPCPSTNPSCISSNPKSSSFAFPWRIPENSVQDAVQKLEEAIFKSQKNPKILTLEETPYGNLSLLKLKASRGLTINYPISPVSKSGFSFAFVLTKAGTYLLAEIDGGFGRDVLEFLVKGDVVGYRSMATKVTYVYPFTTALGDSKGQEGRLKKIMDQLGWYAPSFESMD